MVRASRLFKPYLLALIDNSIRSIEKKQKAGMLTEPGEISVSVEVDSWNPGRATFILRDNGDGVGEERLRELRRFKFGTRFRDDSGSGFGLAAAQRYVSTIDGWMELDSAAGEFFQVTISFQMEKPEGRR